MTDYYSKEMIKGVILTEKYPAFRIENGASFASGSSIPSSWVNELISWAESRGIKAKVEWFTRYTKGIVFQK